MDQFPELFVPSHFEEKDKFSREKRIIDKVTEISNANISFETSTTFDVEKYEDCINEIIKKAKEKVQSKYGNDIITMRVIGGYKKDREGCGKIQGLKVTRWSKDEIHKSNIKRKCTIRKQIIEFLQNNTGPEYIVELEKCRIKLVEEVLEELNKKGWNTELYDHWTHIEDDYSVCDLTISYNKK